MRRKDWKSMKMMNMEKPCAGLAVIVMVLMSSGFAATYVRSGSMANA
jgi:signal peptidase I